MNIALIGYGKMGKIIHETAKTLPDVHIFSIIDPTAVEADFKEVSASSMMNIDVAIDFSHSDAVVRNISWTAQYGIPLIIGTTGWYNKLSEAEAVVRSAGIGLLYASNFSIGVHVFWKVLMYASEIFNNFPQYDIYGYEIHHNQKADSPSGTALTTGKIILDHIQRKKRIVFDKLDRRIESDEVQISSVRGGFVPGTHEICFDSPVDTISLSHNARNRQGFALGALQCAKWIVGKKGFFTIEDYLRDQINIS